MVGVVTSVVDRTATIVIWIIKIVVDCNNCENCDNCGTHYRYLGGILRLMCKM